jgi:hypothetical protein
MLICLCDEYGVDLCIKCAVIIMRDFTYDKLLTFSTDEYYNEWE